MTNAETRRKSVEQEADATRRGWDLQDDDQYWNRSRQQNCY